MAALNFPSSPVTNQIYTANGKSWRWDGTTWKTYNTLSIAGGGTGLTSITTGNAFLSSNSAGTALTYRTFTAGSGMQITVSSNDVTFAATGVTSGTVTGTGTSGYFPIWTSSGTALTDSIVNQFGSTVIVDGQIKAITKSFKIDHPLDPKNKYKTKSGKKVNVADMVKGGRYAWETIATEIQKCRILCMNCHMGINHPRKDLNLSA